jgi:hypothetical protein
LLRRSASVLDQFRTAEEQVAKRLRELKPLVAEYHELQHVAQRPCLNLNDDPAISEQPPAAPRSTTRARRASTTKGRSASTTNRRSAAPASNASGTDAAAAMSATPHARPARPSQNSANKNPAGSNRPSRRQEDILRLVNQRPGIAVGQIARELGVEATGLDRPVRKLEQQGASTKQGVALHPHGR